MTDARRRCVRVLFALAIALLVMGAHAYRYEAFRSDDALISLRYAERLLEGHGLTWNDGERVEGYTNLLWVLACALLGSLGLDLIVATRILGGACVAAAISAPFWLYTRRRDGGLLPALVAALAMALSGSFAVWAMGGLEQPLLVALLAWAWVLLVPVVERPTLAGVPAAALLRPGLLLALVCITRPEGPLFVGCACAVLLVAGRFERPAWRAAAIVALLPIAFVLGQLFFRLVYYGDFVPNTARAKLALSRERVTSGAEYLVAGLRALLPLALAAGAWMVHALLREHDRAVRARAALFALPLLVWSGWVVVIGGDIFPGRRHLMVTVVAMAFLAAELARRASTRSGGRATTMAWGTALGLLATLGGLQWSHDRAHLRALAEVRWGREGEALGKLLGRGFAHEQPLLAVTAAGALPYFSRLPALDMLGLNDRYLALHPPSDLGRGRIAHELGDGRYFLRRAPDLVVFCGTSGREHACSRGGREMQSDPRFAQGYSLVSFVAAEPIDMRGLVYVRVGSPRIGIRVERSGDRVVLPGHLFAATNQADAVLDEDGRLGVRVSAQAPATLRSVALAAGSWRARVDGDADVEIVPGADGGVAGRELHLAAPARVDVRLHAIGRDGSAHVRGVVLERTARASDLQ